MKIGQSHLFEHCKLSPSLFSQNLATHKVHKHYHSRHQTITARVIILCKRHDFVLESGRHCSIDTTSPS